MGFSVHAARQRIEEIMLAAPEAANSDQMKALVQSVKKNISDIRSLLESMEKQVQSGQGAVATAPAMIKKLRNEITKEEVNLTWNYLLPYSFHYTISMYVYIPFQYFVYIPTHLLFRK